MTPEPDVFRNRMRVLVELEGAVLTDRELSMLAERYALCGGKEQWDVREYARRTGLGAREYRVVRGNGVRDVYCSAERVSAAAVQTALNALETEDRGLATSGRPS